MFSKEKKNKGFTLVELIIVVAILAVLVGLLAPQYTKYVEKARKTADVNNLDNIVNAIKIAAIDPEYDLGSSDLKNKPTTSYTIVIGSDITYLIKYNCDQPNRIVEALREYASLTGTDSNASFIIDNVKIKSRKWGPAEFASTHTRFVDSGIAAHILLDNSTGAITVTYSDNVVNYLNHGTIE